MPEKRKVLLAAQHLGIGGLERMMLNLALSLRQRGKYEPSVLSYDEEPGAPTLHREFEDRGIPVHRWKKDAGFSWSIARRLRATLAADGFALLHTHDPGPLIYGQIARLPRAPWPLVHTQHSFVHLARKRRYAIYERVFPRGLSSLCAVSEEIRQQYAKLGLAPHAIEHVENGVSFPEEMAFLSKDRDRVRSELAPGISGRVWILSLARLHPAKGQDHLIRSWALLPPAVQARATLILVGPETSAGEERRLRELARKVADPKSVIFSGPSYRPDDWLMACDAFASASEFEGMPLGPIEALGRGIPCALSDIPGHRPLGERALFFTLHHDEEVSRAMIRLIEADHSLEARAHRWNEARSLRHERGAERMAERYEKIYDHVLRAQAQTRGVR